MNATKSRGGLTRCLCCSLPVGVGVFAFWQLAGCGLNIAWRVTLLDLEEEDPIPAQVVTILRFLAGVVYSLTITKALTFLQSAVAFYLQYAFGAFFALLGFFGACLLLRRLLAVFLFWTFVNYVIHCVDFVLTILNGLGTVQNDVCLNVSTCNEQFKYAFWAVSILRIIVELYFFALVHSLWKRLDPVFRKAVENKPLIHSQGSVSEPDDIDKFIEDGDYDPNSINPPKAKDVPYRGPPRHMAAHDQYDQKRPTHQQPTQQTKHPGQNGTPQNSAPQIRHSGNVDEGQGYKIQLPYICENCMERKRDTIVFPCGHFLYCSKCVTTLTQCGSCNQFITEGKKLG